MKNIAYHMLTSIISRSAKDNKVIASVTMSVELFNKLCQHVEASIEEETLTVDGVTVNKDANFKPAQMFVNYDNE